MKTLTDPRKKFTAPPFPAQQQEFPGAESQLEPRPDFGELTYQGSGRLKGRKALITGGDSGIGRAVALAFAREGANVLIAYYNEHSDVSDLLPLLREAGVRAEALSGDIRQENHDKLLIGAAVEKLGGLDILVNNAAFQKNFDNLESITLEDWEQTLHTNVIAPFFLARAALEVMPPGSAIINTTSVQSYKPSKILLPYAASKGALTNLTKSLAQEASKQGVRVNAVAPGPVWTPLIPVGMPEKAVKNFGSDKLFGRPAQPVEMAPIYVLLASDEASYITGEIWGATGAPGIA